MGSTYEGDVSLVARAAAVGLLVGSAACGSSGGAAAGDAGDVTFDAGLTPVDGAIDAPRQPGQVDGGFVAGDAGVIRADRFITKVVSFTPGTCAGFGGDQMPDIVTGPPIGGGPFAGSLDVVSLGTGGEIVVSFEPNAIVDGPGVDLIVFENPFFSPNRDDAGARVVADAELGEVSVSDDGVVWKTFPCTATFAGGPPYGACAGWHPVFSSPDNGISPVDPSVAGGDPFDLRDVGLTRARFVRVRDKAGEACPANPPRPIANGFDLDAMAIVNAETP